MLNRILPITAKYLQAGLRCFVDSIRRDCETGQVYQDSPLLFPL